MDRGIFEENKLFVSEGLRDGAFDYVEAASEVFEADFLRFIKARTYLDELAETYPMPRKKGEVPFWFYVASNLSMRLHGVQAFDAFPMVVRSGGMLQAFGPKAGHKVVHPETRERRRLSVRDLIRRITTIGRPPAIRIIYARWRRTPMPKPSWDGSIGTWGGCFDPLNGPTKRCTAKSDRLVSSVVWIKAPAHTQSDCCSRSIRRWYFADR